MAVVVLAIVTAAMLFAASTASGNPSGEFLNPSWTELPAPSVYNATPSCPVSILQRYCEVPESAFPPQDPGNRWAFLNSLYWPAEKRPDIDVYALGKYGLEYQNCSEHLPHYCVLVEAQAVGYPVTHSPGVGDLWLAQGRCLEADWGTSGIPPSCTEDQDWYVGYVEEVLPDGSFVISWGGSDTPKDSGLDVELFTSELASYSDFIPLLAPGTPEPEGPPVPRSSNPHLRSAHLRIEISVEPHGLAFTIHLYKKAKGGVKASASCGTAPAKALHVHGSGNLRTTFLHISHGHCNVTFTFVPPSSSTWAEERAELPVSPSGVVESHEDR